ncbi:MAG TPA: hypothetical protein VH302_07095 [Bryobacteraceae bacterium]|jgi:hypothetical protein|nr:hypothetical protein [Bryobacteraceae bacterium]
MPAVKKVLSYSGIIAGAAIVCASCSAPPKPVIPALTPENAASLLQNSAKAQTWITYVKRQNPGCGYQLNIPDQSGQPTTIDLDHIIRCGSAPSPKEFDASASFSFDKDAQKWVLSRFAS